LLLTQQSVHFEIVTTSKLERETLADLRWHCVPIITINIQYYASHSFYFPLNITLVCKVLLVLMRDRKTFSTSDKLFPNDRLFTSSPRLTYKIRTTGKSSELWPFIIYIVHCWHWDLSRNVMYTYCDTIKVTRLKRSPSGDYWGLTIVSYNEILLQIYNDIFFSVGEE